MAKPMTEERARPFDDLAAWTVGDAAWSKCRCGLKHDPSPGDLPPLSSESVIGDELGEVLWLPGHVSDREVRRRVLAHSEWCAYLNFQGAVLAARSYSFVWMRSTPDEQWRECPTDERPCDGGWEDCLHPGASCRDSETCLAAYLRCEHSSDNSPCKPWTRVEVPSDAAYER